MRWTQCISGIIYPQRVFALWHIGPEPIYKCLKEVTVRGSGARRSGLAIGDSERYICALSGFHEFSGLTLVIYLHFTLSWIVITNDRGSRWLIVNGGPPCIFPDMVSQRQLKWQNRKEHIIVRGLREATAAYLWSHHLIAVDSTAFFPYKLVRV